jgi:hypothetical protein
MSYDDWIKNFDNCHISNLTPVKHIETNVMSQTDLRILSVNLLKIILEKYFFY